MLCRSLFVFLYCFLFAIVLSVIFDLRILITPLLHIFKSSDMFIIFLSSDIYGMWYKIHFARIINVLQFINWQILSQTVLTWPIRKAVIFVKGLFVSLYWRALDVVVFMNIPLKIDLLTGKQWHKRQHLYTAIHITEKRGPSIRARCTTLCDKVCQWLRQVVDFLRGLRFPPPIKLTAPI